MGDIRASDPDAVQPSSDPQPQRADGEVTVLVTGFGPFLSQFPINPSHEIAKALPPTLSLPSTTTKIRLLVHPHPVKVAYHPTAALVPKLLATHKPDLVLHVGLAAGRDYFAVERGSERLGFGRNPDVDGRRWTSADSEAAWPSSPPSSADGGDAVAFPDRLETGLVFEDVWARWRKGCEGLEGVSVAGSGGGGGGGSGGGGGGVCGACSGAEEEEGEQREPVDVRPSDDVGNFLCGFIYYASLAWFWRREQEREQQQQRRERKEGQQEEEVAVARPVIFLHVPGCPEERDVQRGREITEALVRAMVGSWLQQRERREGR